MISLINQHNQNNQINHNNQNNQVNQNNQINRNNQVNQHNQNNQINQNNQNNQINQINKINQNNQVNKHNERPGFCASSTRPQKTPSFFNKEYCFPQALVRLCQIGFFLLTAWVLRFLDADRTSRSSFFKEKYCFPQALVQLCQIGFFFYLGGSHSTPFSFVNISAVRPGSPS